MRYRYVNREHKRYRIMTNDKGVFHAAQEFDFVLCQWMTVDEATAKSLTEYPKEEEESHEPQSTVV